MPAFTSVQQIKENGPLVAVSLSIVAAAEQALIDAGQPVPLPITVVMMVDTGASGSVIVPGLAGQLGLHPVGIEQVVTATTDVPVPKPTYAARLTLPNGPVFETTVIEASLHGQAIQGLIGRDVLAECILIYIGYANQFTLAV